MNRTEKNKGLYKKLEKQKKRFLHSYAFYKEMSIWQTYGTRSAFPPIKKKNSLDKIMGNPIEELDRLFEVKK